MEFGVLGPLEVRAHGRALDLGAPKQRALLGALLLQANRVVPRDRLVDLLWDDDPPETAHKALQLYVSRLRKLIGRERLVTKAPGYLVAVGDDELDLARFGRLRDEGRFEEALSLWRGPALADLASHRFAAAEIARLEELRFACVEERIDQELARGGHAGLVGELESLVREHPHRQRLRGQLMLALHRSGRQAEALEAYRSARRSLVDELGLEPGRELRRLQEAIVRDDPELEFRAPAAPRRAAFVGRERELAELAGGLDDAFAGRGRVFLVSGEPGAGKSRLAEELAREATRRGARVLVGRCWEAGGAPAYWPWVQALRAYLSELDPDALEAQLGAGAAEVAQVLPELRGRLPDLPERPDRDSDWARFRLFDAVAQLIRNAAGARPLVLILDDLHAADASSLLLVRFLAREAGGIPLLVLAAYRDVDPIPGAPLAEMVADVGREPGSVRLGLGGLSEREVAQYVELTAADIASAQLALALHRETEGNPLFVGEMVRLLAAEGATADDAGDGRLAIPASVSDAIARRVGHLSEGCGRVLRLASVLGREFTPEALARMAGMSDDDLLDTLDEAMGDRVVADAPGQAGRLRFAHVLIRDTLYDGLTSARRLQLHRLAMQSLEYVYGAESGPHLAELAHHAIAGRAFAQGVRFASGAGDRALALLAFEEAGRLYRTALDALEAAEPGNGRARCALLLSLGEAENRAGDSPAAKQAFGAAADIARRLHLATSLARAALGYGGRMGWGRAGRDDRLVPLLEEALAALADDELELRARVLARLAGALRDEPSRDRRNRLSAEAVELARRSASDDALAYALDGRAVAVCAPDAIEEGLVLGTELCEVARRTGDAERIMAGYDTRIIALLQSGQVGAAQADIAAALDLAEEVKQPARLWEAHSHQTLLALATGRLDEAAALIPKALALGERAVPDGAIPVHRAHSYTLRDFRGGMDEVEPAIRELIADYPARPLFRCMLAHIQARLGRIDEARRILDDLAPDDFATVPFDQEWLYAMSILAETCVLVDDVATAAVLYRLILPWEALCGADPSEGMRGSLARELGLLATALGRLDDADSHFADAIAANDAMGALPWLARAQADHARMLRARGDPADRERADELDTAARATFAELDIQGV